MTATIRSEATYSALQHNGADVLRFGGDTSGQLAGFRNKIINGKMKFSRNGLMLVLC